MTTFYCSRLLLPPHLLILARIKTCPNLWARILCLGTLSSQFGALFCIYLYSVPSSPLPATDWDYNNETFPSEDFHFNNSLFDSFNETTSSHQVPDSESVILFVSCHGYHKKVTLLKTFCLIASPSNPDPLVVIHLPNPALSLEDSLHSPNPFRHSSHPEVWLGRCDSLPGPLSRPGAPLTSRRKWWEARLLVESASKW